jgi:serine protease Do
MSTRKTTVFYVLLIAMASAAIGMIIASRLDLSPASAAQTMAPPPMNSAPLSGPIDSQTFRQIAAAQSPMVVNIRTESRRKTQELTDFFGGGGDDLLRRFFGAPDAPGQQRPRQPREEVTEGAGTGFIIDPSGLILTNNHVIEGATKVEVALFPQPDSNDDGETYEARVVGRDPLTDSALIELVEKPDRKLPAAKFGDSDQMMPGDWVMAIGNPFNLAHTVTVGIISAKGRPFPVAEGRSQQVLQTDAAINPGNSGGPLLNVRGEVIGINTAILSNERGASNLGIGFAIPINAVRELLPQLREGKITRGRIGVQIRGIQPEAVEGLGLKNRRGALVISVEPNSPGSKAGVQRGDVVTEFNGKPVASTDELVSMVVRTRPGTTVPVKVIRNGQERTLNITVEELNLDQEAQQADAGAPDDTTTGFGMTLQDLTPDMARRLRLPSGADGAIVSDLEPRGPAAAGGVQPGDVILEVNRTAVASAAEASRELSRVPAGKAAFLVVWRRGQEVFLTVVKE